MRLCNKKLSLRVLTKEQEEKKKELFQVKTNMLQKKYYKIMLEKVNMEELKEKEAGGYIKYFKKYNKKSEQLDKSKHLVDILSFAEIFAFYNEKINDVSDDLDVLFSTDYDMKLELEYKEELKAEMKKSTKEFEKFLEKKEKIAIRDIDDNQFVQQTEITDVNFKAIEELFYMYLYDLSKIQYVYCNIKNRNVWTKQYRFQFEQQTEYALSSIDGKIQMLEEFQTKMKKFSNEGNMKANLYIL